MDRKKRSSHNEGIATVIVLYILKIGVNIFCDYTEPPAASGGTLPPAK
ncbi:MAG: hypothetical protein RLZZ507_1672 [Cyanobacteriota bacterium]|jgi:hypothetical protein